MINELGLHVQNLTRRSRALCARAIELCDVASRLHATIANATPCPVCGSTAVTPIYRANLSHDSAPTVLAKRCSQGHIFASLAHSPVTS